MAETPSKSDLRASATKRVGDMEREIGELRKQVGDICKYMNLVEGGSGSPVPAGMVEASQAEPVEQAGPAGAIRPVRDTLPEQLQIIYDKIDQVDDALAQAQTAIVTRLDGMRTPSQTLGDAGEDALLQLGDQINAIETVCKQIQESLDDTSSGPSAEEVGENAIGFAGNISPDFERKVRMQSGGRPGRASAGKLPSDAVYDAFDEMLSKFQSTSDDIDATMDRATRKIATVAVNIKSNLEEAADALDGAAADGGSDQAPPPAAAADPVLEEAVRRNTILIAVSIAIGVANLLIALF